ncbi:MAG: hypothetical protein AB1439_01425 [candidate division FCPU426 bacterium]
MFVHTRLLLLMLALAALPLAAAAEEAAVADAASTQTEEALPDDAADVDLAEPEEAVAEPEPEEPALAVAEEQESKAWAILVGFLQGGGSLLGADAEVLIFDGLAVQAGAGYLGYGAALNFHFEPTLHSNYVSLVYWHQGFDQDLSQQAVGLAYGFRAFDWLTGQIGLGYVLARGETAAENLRTAYHTGTLPQLMLLYSIGGYF